MDYFTCFVFLCLLLLSIPFLQKRHSNKNLPPGPFPLPIIGNILQFGEFPHKSLAQLSQKHGPIMSLKLGSIRTIVITSPDIAKEALQKNDNELSSRLIPDAVRACDHHLNSVGWLPATTYQWKKLRRVCATHVFSGQKLKDGESIRRKKVDQLLEYVSECCRQKKAVDIGMATFTAVFNSISNTLFSIDLATYENHSSHKFEKLITGIAEEVGKPNVSDFFPTFRAFDAQGARQKMSVYFQDMFDIFDEIIAQRRASSAKKDDVLDSLLGLEDAGELNRTEINQLLLDLLVAGVDTSKITVEWAMAELLQNPQELRKARNELEEVLGLGAVVQERAIAELPRLQAIVKETFRLHPPGPLLVPRKSEIAIQISGYILPKEAQVVTNVWAIGRDPKVWSNPMSFMPERFFKSKVDYKGRDFELIPFGAGKRICPGLPLAHRMVHLVLASLIQSFDWKLENGLKPKNLDMSEKFGLTLHRANPLYAYPVEISF